MEFQLLGTFQLAGAYPKKRVPVTVVSWLYSDALRLALEYDNDVDYSTSVGGTGNQVSNLP